MAGDAIVIPLGTGIRTLFGGKGATAASAIDGRHRGSMNREDIAMRRMTLSVPVSILQNLHFNATMKRHSAGGDVIGPNEHSRVASRHHVPPFQFHDEILIHPLGA